MSKSSTNYAVFDSMPIIKSLRKMVLPTILSQMIVLSYNLADTFFIGKTGIAEMVAGVSLVLPLYNVTACLSSLAGVGGGALVSRLLGQKNAREARKVCSFSLLLAAGGALILSLGVLLFNHPLLQFMGGRGTVLQYAIEYSMMVIVFGGIPAVLSGTMANLLRSVGYSRQAGAGIMAGGIMNFCLDPLFMFVLLPHGAEIYGAGLATLLSNFAVCIYFSVVFICKRMESPLYFGFRLGLPCRGSVLSLISVGLPSAVASLCYDLYATVMTKVIAGYGDAALASIGIAMKVERLPLNVGTGLCQGAMPLIAYNYSAGNIDRMRGTIRYSIYAGVAATVLSVVFFELTADSIMRFFIHDFEIIQTGSRFLRIHSIATPLMFLSYFIMTVFQGLGHGKEAFCIGVLRWSVFSTGMLLLFNFLWGLKGCLFSQTAADLLTVLLAAAMLYHFNRSIAVEEN